MKNMNHRRIKEKKNLKKPFRYLPSFLIRFIVLGSLPIYILIGIIYGLKETLPGWWEDLTTKYI
jgi:hypothetical protein